MRSAGCVFNDLADYPFDAQVSRTRGRPLATGQVNKTVAVLLASSISLIAFMLVLTMNWATIMMSFVALGLTISYPFMKRIHSLPQVHLGLAFGWAIPMAWVAQTNTVPPFSIWLLYLASICWSIAYDTIYALSDKDEDMLIGVKSSAILFGRHVLSLVAVFQSGVLILLIACGLLMGSGVWFFLGLGIGKLLFIYQQWIIRSSDDHVRAFSNNNYFGLVVFAGIAIDLMVN